MAIENVQAVVVGSVLSRFVPCSRQFPDECKGCLEPVEETDEHNRLYTALTRLFGFYFGPSYIVKRCTRFNWEPDEIILSSSRLPLSIGR